jgi:hypothetical protein
VTVLLDTGVLLNYLNGEPAAAELLECYPHAAISVLSWAELLALAPPGDDAPTRSFLRRFERLALNEAIADRAARLLRQHPELSLPSALGYSTAQVNSLVFVTLDPAPALRSQPQVEVPFRRARSQASTGTTLSGRRSR